MAGIAPTKCCFVLEDCKQCATFVDVSFTHSYINGTQFYRRMRAQSTSAVTAPAAPPAGPSAATDPAEADAEVPAAVVAWGEPSQAADAGASDDEM